MSAAQFDKGPWAVDLAAFPYSPPARVIAKCDGTVIAEAFGDEAKGGADEPEVLANAHLISAAPELYMALAEATELLETDGYSTLEMRAALAKARGQ
jgi:hypothetical protein